MNVLHRSCEINALDSCDARRYRERIDLEATMLTTELLAAGLVLTGAADGCHAGRPFVRVSLEWQARAVPETLRVTVRQEVETIWRRLGVAVQWTERHTPGWLAPAVHVVVTDDMAPGSRGT